MKFTVATQDFIRALSDVSKALPQRTTLPIVQNILMEVKGGKLTLSATNLDFSVKETILVDSKEEGSCTVPGKALINVVSVLPPSTLTVEYVSNTLRLVKENGVYSLVTRSAEDFPRFKEITSGQRFKVKREFVLKGADKVSFCAAREDPRPFLTGVLWHMAGNEMRFVASDSHKLGLWKKKLDISADFQAILPRNVFDLVKSRDDEEVEVLSGSDIMAFYFSDAELVTRLIEGPYAAYEEVIPKEEGYVFKTPTNEFISTLRRILVFTEKPTYLVKWHLTPGHVTLFAQSPEVGEATEVLDGDYTGIEMDVGFNAQYLLETVRHIDSDEIIFHFYSPLSAVVLNPSETPEDEELLYLIMPIKLE
ncbi:MAG: DNA polymerase III subunit beta [Candidatus Hydrothermota bacterium]|uniref:Beta sliding clamp n=1 Tax=candidate division WOR-3 bacterium TaxID=2052148 RepID=A0A7C1BE47_UNCW3|nr:MAG: DNA polymerase III subunit beta [Candidatus Hydrothermae bacterium]HDM90689.1 DNA polymerase III subunit beta [candidate division WOR-3 bacterium]